jgi:hypothetical protein
MALSAPQDIIAGILSLDLSDLLIPGRKQRRQASFGGIPGRDMPYLIIKWR